MPGVTRTGDLYGMGGVVIGSSASNVTADGRPIALNGANYTPHVLCSPKSIQHCFGSISSKVKGVRVNGVPPLVQGSKGSCGHAVGSSSQVVIITG